MDVYCEHLPLLCGAPITLTLLGWEPLKCILRKYGYPPDKQEKATQTVLKQAEILSEAWAIA